MKIITEISEMKAYIKENKGKSIGLVPTMGCLHDGHKSLIERAASENDIAVVSIFVNPTQFGAGEDLDKYPRTPEHDREVAESAGAKVIFRPDPAQMYPDGYKTYLSVEEITSVLCGKTRPTHFRGVTTVVSKLFNIVSPDRAYFGQKDAQQLAVIYRMTEDMNFDVKIIACPIVREKDGLAMSSRNSYLSKEERSQAVILNKALNNAQKLYGEGERSLSVLTARVRAEIGTMPLAEIEYVEGVKFPSLQPCGGTITEKTLIALAVRFGSARLIDNIILS